MKKLTAIALCMVLMLACTAVFAESQEQQTGVYTIYNVTGENVAWIELLDNVTGDSTKVDFPDGLANGASVQMTKSIPASEDGNHRLTLSFETESGYAGTFATLSIEEAPISLLAQDALSGATQISFTKPEATEKETIGKVSLNGAFTLQGKLPEGFKVQDLTPEELKDSAHFSMIHSDDTTKPFMYLSIGLNELLTEVDRLNDLDEAALAQIEQTFTEDDNVVISYTETAHGTKLMKVQEADAAVNYVDFYTIYKGYEIEFVLIKGEEGTESLSDAEIQMAVDFLSNLDFVAAE